MNISKSSTKQSHTVPLYSYGIKILFLNKKSLSLVKKINKNQVK